MSNSSETVDRAGDPVDQLPESGLPVRKGLLVVLLCLVFNMLDGFDITAMSVTASQVSQEMSLSDDRLGLIFSFSLAGMTIGAMFLSSISDVLGRRKVVIASLLVVGLSVLLTAAVDAFYQLLLLRFISGMGAGTLLASQAALALGGVFYVFLHTLFPDELDT